MIKLLRRFVDQLVALIVPKVAGMVAAAIDSVYSLLVAEAHAELEEAARKYESQGLLDVATALRKRLAQLTDDKSAATEVKILENLWRDDASCPTPEEPPSTLRLPKRRGPSSKTKKAPHDESQPPSSLDSDQTLTTF